MKHSKHQTIWWRGAVVFFVDPPLLKHECTGIMERRYYGQLKELMSDRSGWRQDNNWEIMSEACW